MDNEVIIESIDTKINKLVQIIGTRSDGEEVITEVQPSNEEHPNKDTNSLTTQATKVKPQTLSNILTYITNTKNKLLEDNSELKTYYDKIKNNKYLIDNFCNYANTSLNIRDRAKLIYNIREDIFDLAEKINRLDEFNTQLETMKTMEHFIRSKLDNKQQARMSALVKRAEDQKKEVVVILEVYKEIIEYMNEKLVKRSTQNE